MSKEDKFNLLLHGNMWRIPLCIAAFTLFPKGNCYAEANVMAVNTPVETLQQQRTVRGIVVDENGIPIIGATIKILGTTNGTISDMDGKFELNVDSKSVLEVSYIGYSTQKVKLNSSSSIQITLKEETEVLNEVVVTGFGMAQKKATLTGAVSSVKSTDIERSSAVTASGALVGKIAGLNSRQQGGAPGATTALQIRNMGTPLFVIDGVVSDEGQFNNMDFNDIENISILKDASAALYGVRAANGVIVVTTKKGQRNTRNTVSVDAYYGWQKNSKFVDPADVKEYVHAYTTAETFSGRTDGNRRYSREEYDKWMAGATPAYQGWDWGDYIWISAPQYYINTNFSGGTDKANYYVAVSHINQDATIRNYGGFRRTNAQMNIEMNVNEKFKIGASMNGRIEEKIGVILEYQVEMIRGCLVLQL